MPVILFIKSSRIDRKKPLTQALFSSFTLEMLDIFVQSEIHVYCTRRKNSLCTAFKIVHRYEESVSHLIRSEIQAANGGEDNLSNYTTNTNQMP